MILKYSGLFALLYLVVAGLVTIIFNLMEWSGIDSQAFQVMLTLFVASNLTGVRFANDQGRAFEKPERMQMCLASIGVFFLISILGGLFILYFILPIPYRDIIISVLQQQEPGLFAAIAIFASGIAYLILFLTYGPITSQYARKKVAEEKRNEQKKDNEEASEDQENKVSGNDKASSDKKDEN